MICNHCKGEIESNSKYCNLCGEIILHQSNQQPVNTSTPTKPKVLANIELYESKNAANKLPTSPVTKRGFSGNVSQSYRMSPTFSKSSGPPIPQEPTKSANKLAPSQSLSSASVRIPVKNTGSPALAGASMRRPAMINQPKNNSVNNQQAHPSPHPHSSSNPTINPLVRSNSAINFNKPNPPMRGGNVRGGPSPRGASKSTQSIAHSARGAPRNNLNQPRVTSKGSRVNQIQSVGAERKIEIKEITAPIIPTKSPKDKNHQQGWDEISQKIFQANNSKSTSLILTSLQLVSFPTLIIHHAHFQSNLTELDLSYNQITRIPGSLIQLKALVILNVSFNHLVSLPVDFLNFKTLQEIKLEGNPLDEGLKECSKQGISGVFQYLQSKALSNNNQDASKHTNSPSEQNKSPLPALTFNAASQANLLEKITIGLRFALSSYKNRAIQSDFTDIHFLKKAQQPHNSPDGTYVFREYARDVFRNLRVKYLNIKDEEYLSSLCDFPYSELGVSGRSGSFLYISHDNRFIIKTITPGESKFFRKVLPHYYNHIKTKTKSKLSRFCGMYRFFYFTNDIRFVVMLNAFPPNRTIHERYDLKGSTVGRRTIHSRKFEPEAISEVIMKDVDLTLRMCSNIQLGRSRKLEFLKTVKEDCEFMEHFEIMDYSLLLGVHFVTADAASPECNANGELEDGGLWAENNEGERLNEIYYMTIIDILQPYNTRKLLEHSMKSFLYESKQISVVPPDQYALRFQNFLANVIV